MPVIVVMDDDAGTRMLVSQVLKKEGFDVLAAEDGAKGLDLIREFHPDVIVSDVQMPNLDGFGVIEQVRAEESTATIPIILLTSLQDRAHMRQGMTTGADDYLTKPFAPQELREAVNAQLNKLVRAEAVQAHVIERAVAQALEEQQHKISKLYERRMAKELSEQWPDSGFVQENEKFASATVLHADMRDYGLWTNKLSSSELGSVVQQFYSSVGDTVHLFGAHHMQFIGDGMLCVFTDSGDTASVNHGLRAIRAALGLVDGMRRIDGYVRQRFGERGLPAFRLSMALHSGPVAFARLDGLFGTSGQSTPVGDTVSAALKLFAGEPPLDWTVAASVQTTRLVAGAIKTNRRAIVKTPGRNMPIDVLEVIGLQSQSSV
jgi:DNA-binding response OmpR family regulator